MTIDLKEIERTNRERTKEESELVRLGFKPINGSDGAAMSDGKTIYYLAMEVNGARMYRPTYQQT